MRLASISLPGSTSQSDLRDGRLVVVVGDGTHGILPEDPRCRTMRDALDDWANAEPVLREIAATQKGTTVDLSQATFMAPMPRASDFLDGSAYLSHIERVRRARRAVPPQDMRSNPLMYRGIAKFLYPQGDIPVTDFQNHADCEGELAVIVDDVPAGVSPEDALQHVRLLTQINDVSLRGVIGTELPKQFGFLNGKPPSSAGPLCVTPDELGDDWNDGRPRLSMRVKRGQEIIGELSTEEIHFSIGQLIAHAASTYPLSAGTIIGTGTISNKNEANGVACIAEQVALDTTAGRAVTPYLQEGEQVSIETFHGQRSLFGKMINRFVQG
jgi:fumarylacetoacetate (FAA) hydrolase